MPFTVPTLDEQHAILLAIFKVVFANLNSGKGANVAQGSFNWLWLRTLAAAVTDNHAHIDADQNDLMPDTLYGPMQDRWGAIKKIPRNGATPARKSKALRISGTPTTTVPVGLQLAHTSGLLFQVTNADVVGPQDYVDVDVEALSTGSATRLSKDEHLTVQNTPTGLAEDAVLVLDLDEGGEDQEDNGSYQGRILDSFQHPALGGASGDYATWAKQVTDVAQAYEYPRRAGVGTVDLAFLHAGRGGDRIPTAPEVAAVQAYVDTKRPVSVLDFRVLQVTEHVVNVDYTAVTDGELEHAFDWDDTAGPTCLTWDDPSRTLQFAGGARPPTLQVGGRISIARTDGAGNGAQRIVESFDPVHADKVVLEVLETGDVPDVGAAIYAGGAIVEPVRQAILGLFDALGPANPDATRYGAWEGNLRPVAISRKATGVDGVIDGTVVLPAATVAAVDTGVGIPGEDDSVELLIAGRVIVRAQH
jgi:uncharacterized phage protein gp47/JayE